MNFAANGESGKDNNREGNGDIEVFTKIRYESNGGTTIELSRSLSNHVQCLDPDLEFLFSQFFISQLLFLVGDVAIPKIIDAGNDFQKLASALKFQLSLQGFKYPSYFCGVVESVV